MGLVGPANYWGKTPGNGVQKLNHPF